MNGATHVDLSAAVAKCLGLSDEYAAEAAFPDEIRSIIVPGLGAHFAGLNFASVVHFEKPQRRAGKVISFGGYCWESDRSVRGIVLPHVWVRSACDAWGMSNELGDQEPLWRLLSRLKRINPKTGRQAGSTYAGEMTYPTAGSMVDWLVKCYRVVLRTSRKHAERIRFWILHFVQDCCVPHHAQGMMLRGHSAFEGKIEETWRKVRMSRWLTSEHLRWILAAPARSPRFVCEEAAVVSEPGLPVEQVIRNGVIATASALKYLMALQ